MPDGCIYEDSLTIEVLRVGCQSEGTGQLGDNIFPNGDFGTGSPNILPVNPGIAPGYIYTTNPPPTDGPHPVPTNTAWPFNPTPPSHPTMTHPDVAQTS